MKSRYYYNKGNGEMIKFENLEEMKEFAKDENNNCTYIIARSYMSEFLTRREVLEW